jgi:hypothetical protein
MMIDGGVAAVHDLGNMQTSPPRLPEINLERQAQRAS